MKIINILKDSKKYRKIIANNFLQKTIRMYVLVILTCVLLFTAVTSLYFSKDRFAFFSQYYNLYFALDSLNGLKLGSRVFYQGGLIIGFIEDIDRFYDQYFVKVKIKKDILLSKSNSFISLKTWGLLGENSINIVYSSTSGTFERYLPGSVIYIPAAPFDTSPLKKFENEGFVQFTEKSFTNLKNNIENIRQQKIFQPYYISQQIKSLTLNTSLSGFFDNTKSMISKYNANFQKTQENFPEPDKVGGELNKMVDSIKNIKNMTDYSKNILKKRNNFFYQDDFYLLGLEYLKNINRLLEKYKEKPNRILYGL